jgi:hypothetical protein
MFDLFNFSTDRAAYVELQRLNESDSLPTGNTSLFYKALCPTESHRNVLYRQRIMELAFDHPRADEYRELFRNIAARDLLWYVNTFLYTHSPKDYPDQPIRPFVTWPYQNRDLLKLQAAIGKHDINITKSRDMGATWLCLLAIEHRWHFRPHQKFLIASEKEELVDKPGDMRSLFEKIDFLHKYQPVWIRPRTDASKRHRGNADNLSTIDGEATVRDLGRSDRLTACMIDEYASISFTEEIERATRDATNCRIRNSTPKPRNAEGGQFFKFFDREFKRDPSPENPKLIIQHWTQHPLKAAGLYKRDPSGINVPLDHNTYDFRSDFPFTDQNKPRSPWYDEQCERVTSNLEIAQELDLDFYGLGQRAFEAALLSKLLLNTKPPAQQFQLFLDDNNQLVFIPNCDGNFRLWCPFPQNEPPLSTYVFGEDIAAGTGTSNSAICIIDSGIRQVVATFKDNSIDPAKFAQLANALGRLFHNAFHVPEVNGPTGQQFLVAMIPMNTNVFMRSVHTELPLQRKSKRYGIHNSDRGTLLLTQLHIDLRSNQLTIPDEQTLQELSEYELADDAKFKHGGAQDADSEAHGDLAIATAAAALGLRERPGLPPPKVNAAIPSLADTFASLNADDALSGNCMAARLELHDCNDRFDPWEP